MIEISGLVAGYGGLDILRGVDLSVDRGGITCIVGPNGAGKSTVLKAVSGVLRPKAGSVTIDGTDLTGRDPEAILRAGVAQVPQRGGLFTRLTVRQNVLMGGYVIRKRRKHHEARYDADDHGAGDVHKPARRGYHHQASHRAGTESQHTGLATKKILGCAPDK